MGHPCRNARPIAKACHMCSAAHGDHQGEHTCSGGLTRSTSSKSMAGSRPAPCSCASSSGASSCPHTSQLESAAAGTMGCHIITYWACLQRSVCRRGAGSTQGPIAAARRSLLRAIRGLRATVRGLRATVGLPNGARQAVKICRVEQHTIGVTRRAWHNLGWCDTGHTRLLISVNFNEKVAGQVDTCGAQGLQREECAPFPLLLLPALSSRGSRARRRRAMRLWPRPLLRSAAPPCPAASHGCSCRTWPRRLLGRPPVAHCPA